MNPQTPGACQGCNHSAAPIARPGLYAPGANETDVPVENIYHRSTGALNTSVTTKKGVVTLGGKAKNATEKDLATKLVNDVNGVKNVKNLMTIE